MNNYFKLIIGLPICTIYFAGGFVLGFQNGQYKGALNVVKQEQTYLRNRVYPGAILPDSLVLQSLPNDYTLGNYE